MKVSVTLYRWLLHTMLNLSIAERFGIFFFVFADVIYDIVLNFGAVKIFTVKTKGRNKRMRIIQRIKVSG